MESKHSGIFSEHVFPKIEDTPSPTNKIFPKTERTPQQLAGSFPSSLPSVSCGCH